MTRPPYCRCKNEAQKFNVAPNVKLKETSRGGLNPGPPLKTSLPPQSVLSKQSELSLLTIGSRLWLWTLVCRIEKLWISVSLRLTSVPVSTVLWFSDAGQDWWWFAPHHKHRTHSDGGGWQTHSSFWCAAPVPLHHSTSDWHRAFCLTYFNLGFG